MINQITESEITKYLDTLFPHGSVETSASSVEPTSASSVELTSASGSIERLAEVSGGITNRQRVAYVL